MSFAPSLLVLNDWVNSVVWQKQNQAEKFITFCWSHSISHLFKLVMSGVFTKHQSTKEEMGLHDQLEGWGESL